nr:MAG TPA: hypothetical protein [Caudoviricetes sp.]DAI63435.1 MAG TPA: hypothetical protein [Caudoviricetes sp.]DAL30516.1 MAG TPA_asm: hypothetical protein [Caudoviricetes sp.]DAL38590.1 MAG TPA_asm: hypothetical protein [Caudoviricetes sp.]DAN03411.1 MAG TPA: hypothetical protein [Caudoviricetes sp.]
MNRRSQCYVGNQAHFYFQISISKLAGYQPALERGL